MRTYHAHARPGEPLQLYTGMRTKACRKLRDVDPICVLVSPIRLIFDRSGRFLKSEIDVGKLRTLEDQTRFARADGFETIHDMAEFWFANHGLKGQKLIAFRGLVIEWEPA